MFPVEVLRYALGRRGRRSNGHPALLNHLFKRRKPLSLDLVNPLNHRGDVPLNHVDQPQQRLDEILTEGQPTNRTTLQLLQPSPHGSILLCQGDYEDARKVKGLKTLIDRSNKCSEQ